MGRAIDMENDIGALKIKIQKLENTVRGMVSKLDELLDELDEKSTKTKHIDLVEEVGADVEDSDNIVTGESKDEKEETNDEGNGKSSKSSNNNGRKSKNKSK